MGAPRRTADPQYVQQRFPDYGPVPLTRPVDSPKDERQRAIDASVRYLDAIKERATNMSLTAGDRLDTLADLDRRRNALRRVKRKP